MLHFHILGMRAPLGKIPTVSVAAPRFNDQMGDRGRKAEVDPGKDLRDSLNGTRGYMANRKREFETRARVYGAGSTIGLVERGESHCLARSLRLRTVVRIDLSCNCSLLISRHSDLHPNFFSPELSTAP